MHSYDASTRRDLPIPYEALSDLVAYLEPRIGPVLIVGAVARDLLASAAGELPIDRATRDIDIAVAITTPRSSRDSVRSAPCGRCRTMNSVALLSTSFPTARPRTVLER